MRKQLVFLLVLALCLSLIPGLALADVEEGDGSNNSDEPPTSLKDLLVNRHGVYVEEDERESQGAIIDDLLVTFGVRNYDGIKAEDITITAIAIDSFSTDHFGTFSYTVEYGDATSEPQTGYILEDKQDFLLRFAGEDEHGNEIEEFKVVASGSEDFAGFKDRIVVPSFGDGCTMEIIARGNVIMAPMGVGAERTKEKFDDSGRLKCPFYSANLHITNLMGGEDEINLFSCYIFQKNAIGLDFSWNKTDGEELNSVEWDLDNFLDFTEDRKVTTQIFFTNNEIKLAFPEKLSPTALTIDEGEFQGYKVEKTNNDDNKYTITFLSNYYDDISLEVTIGNNSYILNIQRVGVKISEHDWAVNKEMNVFHGTQNGSNIDFTEFEYQIFASYHMPDKTGKKPYGLFVTKIYRNGTVETELITEPRDDPHDSWKDKLPEEEDKFENDIFKYAGHAWVVDYLIHAQEDATNAPVKVNVLVLAGDPKTGGGVNFGSGAGVTWEKGD